MKNLQLDKFIATAVKFKISRRKTLNTAYQPNRSKSIRKIDGMDMFSNFGTMLWDHF